MNTRIYQNLSIPIHNISVSKTVHQKVVYFNTYAAYATCIHEAIITHQSFSRSTHPRCHRNSSISHSLQLNEASITCCLSSDRFWSLCNGIYHDLPSLALNYHRSCQIKKRSWNLFVSTNNFEAFIFSGSRQSRSFIWGVINAAVLEIIIPKVINSAVQEMRTAQGKNG